MINIIQMSKPKIRASLILASLGVGLLLTGCTGMSSDYGCSVSPGVPCTNMDQVNNRVDQGTIPGENSDADTDSVEQTSSDSEGANDNTNSNIPSSYGNYSTPYPGGVMANGEPIRYGETVMRIWIAPFVDSSDNYHQPEDIYTVIQKGHWIGDPPKAILPEDESGDSDD